MRHICFILFLLLLASCKKERTIHITAKNAVTGLPYAGLTYYVVQEKTGMSGEEFTTVATGTLDNNGEAYITKKLSKRFSYAVRVEEPPNTCYNKKIAFNFANQETVFECPFEFAECAYLKLNINNTNCIDANDEINFRRIWLHSSELYNYVQRFGCYNFSGDYFAIPMGNYKYEWIVTKNGVTNYFDSTFTLNENQYYEFTINY